VIRRATLVAAVAALFCAATTAATALPQPNDPAGRSNDPAAGSAAPIARSWTVDHGPVEARVSLGADGAPTIAVSHRGDQMLAPSPLGIVTDRADLSRGLTFAGRHDRRVRDSYRTLSGKQRRRSVDMTESLFAFRGPGTEKLSLVLAVRAAEDGVAYRYMVVADRVLRESSSYRLPAGATAWLNAEDRAYENEHRRYDAASAPSGRFNVPALFGVGSRYVLVSESDLDGRYSGARLAHVQGSDTYTVELADAAVDAGGGVLATPWRTAVVGDLATVTESTLTDDLAPESRVRDTSWIRPGRVAWSWLAGFHGLQRDFEGQQRFVDYAALHGWEYVLVDDGWNTTTWMPELVDYARRRGVGIMAWIHWTSIPAAERDELLGRLRDWGVVGVKIDFMDSDGQARLRWYDEALRKTAELELMVNFHGTMAPRGLQRTWPHVLTMEAVRGAEFGGGNTPPSHLTTLPFTRNAVGSMDFTPMAFHDGNRPMTDAAEVGLAVLYESGLQHYAGTLASYRERPVAERFLEQVPTVWEGTRLLSGAPGEEAVIARRDADDRWFVGGLRAGPAGVLRVPTGFLGGGEWRVEIVQDGAGGALVERTEHVRRGDFLTVPLAEDGGFAAVFCRGRSCARPVDRVPTTSLTVSPTDAVDVRSGETTVVEVSGTLRVDSDGSIAASRLEPVVPDGWTVEGGAATAERLEGGEALSGSWRVRVPPGAEPGIERIPVVASYRVPDRRDLRERLEVERGVSVRIAPPGSDWLSSLPFVSASNGWGPVERDRANGETGAADGSPMRIAGVPYETGVGVHAHSEIVVDLGGRYERFVSRVGVDDEVYPVDTRGSVAFQVVGDGRVLADSGVVRDGEPAKLIDVDVSGVQRLLLRVTDGGDGKNDDHGDWASAHLVLAR
jgi:alpha-glucosidase